MIFARDANLFIERRNLVADNPPHTVHDPDPTARLPRDDPGRGRSASATAALASPPPSLPCAAPSSLAEVSR